MADEKPLNTDNLPEPEPEDAQNYHEEVPAVAGSTAPGYNAADRQQVKDKKRRQDDRTDMRRETLKAILGQRNGRDFLAWVLLEVGCLHSALEAVSFNPAVVHFFAGRRQVALDLQAEALRADRDNYMLMLKEHLS